MYRYLQKLSDFITHILAFSSGANATDQNNDWLSQGLTVALFTPYREDVPVINRCRGNYYAC
jgi:hypothetical protein